MPWIAARKITPRVEGELIKKINLNKRNLLGFSADGEALFDTVVTPVRAGSGKASSSLGTVAGVGKAVGGIKLISAAQLVGSVKDN